MKDTTPHLTSGAAATLAGHRRHFGTALTFTGEYVELPSVVTVGEVIAYAVMSDGSTLRCESAPEGERIATVGTAWAKSGFPTWTVA